MIHFLVRKELRKANRIVVKIGTNTITKNGEFNVEFAKNLAKELVELREKGKEIVIVSSGAIGLGNNHLGWNKTTNLTKKQCSASVGQGLLINNYREAFGKMPVSQLLVTREDLRCTERRNSIKEIIKHSHKEGIITIINENDSLSTEEISFGDNDVLSAHITNVIGADLLVLLTNVDGIYSNIERKEKINHTRSLKDVQQFVSSVMSENGTGGMNSKLMAARIAAYCGAKTVIANGTEQNRITKILEGEEIGTLIDL